MSDILAEIVAHKKIELTDRFKKRSLSTLKAMAEPVEKENYFLNQLKSCRPAAIIAECKMKSPSKGLICPNYDPVRQAGQYYRGGAAAISVLTDHSYFGGDHEHLRNVSREIDLPVLCKDFIIDEYQVYEARYFGASSFLLIAGVLDTAELQYFIEVGRDLGMEPLVESHTLNDLELALPTDAKIFGINNRNLKTMTVDFSHILQFKSSIESKHPDAVLVCESGVTGPSSIEMMTQEGINSFLVGEHLMKAENPEQTLKELLDLKH